MVCDMGPGGRSAVSTAKRFVGEGCAREREWKQSAHVKRFKYLDIDWFGEIRARRVTKQKKIGPETLSGVLAAL